jgi:hypothetical protein
VRRGATLGFTGAVARLPTSTFKPFRALSFPHWKALSWGQPKVYREAIMRFTIRAFSVLALLAAACGGSNNTGTSGTDLGVAQCRPYARCGFGAGENRYCADLATDSSNCGTCGHACGPGFACVSGVCTYSCTDGLVACPTGTGTTSCVDVSSSEVDCGACGNACAPDQFCDAGTCRPACTDGLTNCGTPDARVCLDLQTDTANCGACGSACPAQHACVQGHCTLICYAPETRCDLTGVDPYCANFQTDSQNCGGCGNVCGGGRACVSGVCTVQCAQGLAACGVAPNDSCVDLQTDNANCGGCGTVCGSGQACQAGACVLQCATGLLHCGTGTGQFCTDASSDNANCGACGNACGANFACVSGACTPVCGGFTPVSCGSGATLTCVDVNSDPLNCGGCGITCSVTRPLCVEGMCSVDLNAASYVTTTTFQDRLGAPAATLAFDGTAFWTYGQPTVTYNMGQYTPTGALSGQYNRTLKMISLFSPGGNGAVYSRYQGSPYIYRMQTPSNLVYLLPLKGGTLVTESAVAMKADGTEFLALANGTVSRWTATGVLVESFALPGFGTVAGESGSPQASRLALASGKILTYSMGTLSIWDVTWGTPSLVNSRRSTVLTGAGTSVDSHYSLSYANGLVWIWDGPGGLWRGYDIGL